MLPIEFHGFKPYLITGIRQKFLLYDIEILSFRRFLLGRSSERRNNCRVEVPAHPTVLA